MKYYKRKGQNRKNQLAQKSPKQQSVWDDHPVSLPFQKYSGLSVNSHFQVRVSRLMVAGQSLNRQKLLLKTNRDNKSISMIFVRDRELEQLRIQNISNQNLTILFSRNRKTVCFKLVAAARYQIDTNQTGQHIWKFAERIDNKIAVMQGSFNQLQAYLNDIVPSSRIQCTDFTETLQNWPPQTREAQEYLNDKDSEICFPLPTQKVLSSLDQIKTELVHLGEEEKQQIAFEILKIKKFYKNQQQQFQCPLYTCRKTYRTMLQIKNHLQKHSSLVKYGFTINQDQQLQFAKKAFDFVLLLAHLYPHEIKKIIKKMKAIPNQAIDFY